MGETLTFSAKSAGEGEIAGEGGKAVFLILKLSKNILLPLALIA